MIPDGGNEGEISYEEARDNYNKATRHFVLARAERDAALSIFSLAQSKRDKEAWAAKREARLQQRELPKGFRLAIDTNGIMVVK